MAETIDQLRERTRQGRNELIERLAIAPASNARRQTDADARELQITPPRPQPTTGK